MTIFDVLNLIGGLCLFLFGMNVMGDGLERRAGNSLKALLGKLTNSPIKGFLTGLGLAIVKHGAAFHNAEVSLESTEEKGTSVTITFAE